MLKGRKGESTTEKVRKENVWLVPLPSQPGSYPNPFSSFLVQGLGRVSGSDCVDDGHKQTRNWI